MALPPSDTDPETERVHLELLRAAGPVRRAQMALSLSADVITLARDELKRQNPDASDREIGLRFVERHYGRELADEMRTRLQP